MALSLMHHEQNQQQRLQHQRGQAQTSLDYSSSHHQEQHLQEASALADPNLNSQYLEHAQTAALFKQKSQVPDDNNNQITALSYQPNATTSSLLQRPVAEVMIMPNYQPQHSGGGMVHSTLQLKKQRPQNNHRRSSTGSREASRSLLSAGNPFGSDAFSGNSSQRNLLSSSIVGAGAAQKLQVVLVNDVDHDVYEPFGLLQTIHGDVEDSKEVVKRMKTRRKNRLINSRYPKNEELLYVDSKINEVAPGHKQMPNYREPQHTQEISFAAVSKQSSHLPASPSRSAMIPPRPKSKKSSTIRRLEEAVTPPRDCLKIIDNSQRSSASNFESVRLDSTPELTPKNYNPNPPLPTKQQSIEPKAAVAVQKHQESSSRKEEESLPETSGGGEQQLRKVEILLNSNHLRQENVYEDYIQNRQDVAQQRQVVAYPDQNKQNIELRVMISLHDNGSIQATAAPQSYPPQQLSVTKVDEKTTHPGDKSSSSFPKPLEVDDILTPNGLRGDVAIYGEQEQLPQERRMVVSSLLSPPGNPIHGGMASTMISSQGNNDQKGGTGRRQNEQRPTISFSESLAKIMLQQKPNNKMDHKQTMFEKSSKEFNMPNRNSRESTALSASVRASKNVKHLQALPLESTPNERGISPFTIRELGSLHSSSSIAALNERESQNDQQNERRSVPPEPPIEVECYTSRTNSQSKGAEIISESQSTEEVQQRKDPDSNKVDPETALMVTKLCSQYIDPKTKRQKKLAQDIQQSVRILQSHEISQSELKPQQASQQKPNQALSKLVKIAKKQSAFNTAKRPPKVQVISTDSYSSTNRMRSPRDLSSGNQIPPLEHNFSEHALFKLIRVTNKDTLGSTLPHRASLGATLKKGKDNSQSQSILMRQNSRELLPPSSQSIVPSNDESKRSKVLSSTAARHHQQHQKQYPPPKHQMMTTAVDQPAIAQNSTTLKAISKQKQPTQGSSQNLSSKAAHSNTVYDPKVCKLLTNTTNDNKRSQPVYKMRILRTSSHTIHELDKARQSSQHLITSPKGALNKQSDLMQSQVVLKTQNSSQLRPKQQSDQMISKKLLQPTVRQEGDSVSIQTLEKGDQKVVQQYFYRQLSDRSHQPQSKRNSLIGKTKIKMISKPQKVVRVDPTSLTNESEKGYNTAIAGGGAPPHNNNKLQPSSSYNSQFSESVLASVPAIKMIQLKQLPTGGKDRQQYRLNQPDKYLLDRQLHKSHKSVSHQLLPSVNAQSVVTTVRKRIEPSPSVNAGAATFHKSSGITFTTHTDSMKSLRLVQQPLSSEEQPQLVQAAHGKHLQGHKLRKSFEKIASPAQIVQSMYQTQAQLRSPIILGALASQGQQPQAAIKSEDNPYNSAHAKRILQEHYNIKCRNSNTQPVVFTLSKPSAAKQQQQKRPQSSFVKNKRAAINDPEAAIAALFSGKKHKKRGDAAPGAIVWEAL